MLFLSVTGKTPPRLASSMLFLLRRCSTRAGSASLDSSVVFQGLERSPVVTDIPSSGLVAPVISGLQSAT